MDDQGRSGTAVGPQRHAPHDPQSQDDASPSVGLGGVGRPTRRGVVGGQEAWSHTSRRPPCGRLRGRSLRDVLGILLVMLGGLASVATNLADDEKDSGQTDEQGLVTCEAADDCAEHESTPHCLESYGLCVACLEDGDCGEQERCYEYRCAASCTSSASCGGELVCIDGLCRECQSDVDCGDPSQYCYVGPTFNACRPLCASSADCSGAGFVDGDVCRAGRCQVVECDAAQDCLVDREVCDVDTGQCRSLLPGASH